MKTMIKQIFLALLILASPFPILAQQWEEQAKGLLPIDYGISSMSILDENTVWAVAWDKNYLGSPLPVNHISKVLRTTNGGSTWNIYDVEEAIGRKTIDIVAFDSVTALITTQDHNNGQGRSVFKTNDGGVNWVEKFKHHACGIHIRFFNKNEGVLVNRPDLYTTNDGGDTWNPADSIYMALFQSTEYHNIYSAKNSLQLKDDNVWFGTTHGRVFRSKDKGHTWEAFNTPLGNVVSIAFKDTLVGVALQPNLSGALAYTVDGGENWAYLASNTLGLQDIEFVPGTDSILVGSSINNMSAYSKDLGKTWNIIAVNHRFGATHFISPIIGWTSTYQTVTANEATMHKWDSNIFLGAEDKDDRINFQVIPNPSSGRYTLQLDRMYDGLQLSIRNYLGQKISKQTFQNENWVNFEINAPSGYYFLELVGSNGETGAIKIFKN